MGPIDFNFRNLLGAILFAFFVLAAVAAGALLFGQPVPERTFKWDSPHPTDQSKWIDVQGNEEQEITKFGWALLDANNAVLASGSLLGPARELRVAVPAGAKLLRLRAFDRAGNVSAWAELALGGAAPPPPADAVAPDKPQRLREVTP